MAIIGFKEMWTRYLFGENKIKQGVNLLNESIMRDNIVDSI